MTLNVNLIEGIWVAVVMAALGITVWALLDAWRDAQAVHHLNGHVRGIVARGNVRRESLRFLTQISLLGIVLPSLFRDGDTPVTYGLLIVMAVPLLLLANSFLDHQDRHRIARRLVADIEKERLAGIKKLTALAEDTNAIATETNERVIDIQERA